MTKEICVVNRKGLHARPATVFAEAASEYPDEIKVAYGKKNVTGKSLIALMSLTVPRDGIVTISIEGNNARAVMIRLEEILGINYD
jgi:phosphotransferase system HPr (HPr) family protein